MNFNFWVKIIYVKDNESSEEETGCQENVGLK